MELIYGLLITININETESDGVAQVDDLEIHSLAGGFSTGSRFESRSTAVLNQKPVDEIKINIEPEEHLDFEHCGRDDQGVTGTAEQITASQEPLLDTRATRKEKLLSKARFASMSMIKNNFRAFVRKLSGKSKGQKCGGRSPRLASVRSATLVTVTDDDLNNSNRTPTSTGAVSAHSMSPVIATSFLLHWEMRKTLLLSHKKTEIRCPQLKMKMKVR